MSDTDYLQPTPHIDSAHPAIAAFCEQTGNDGTLRERAVRLYEAVRDGIVYDPYVDMTDEANFTASAVLAQGRGFCIGKAALLAACARAIGIPARVGYADVRNHMTSRRIQDLLETDVFYWHSFAELLIDGAWVKATPAFDAALCRRVGLEPLAFDGRTDSLFQPFDDQGRRRMEYLFDRGSFADVPFGAIAADFRAHYPKLMAREGIEGDFRAEAVAGDAAAALARQ